MSKNTTLGILFFFGAILGGFFYLDYTHFFEIDTCLDAGWGWNYEESACKTWEDQVQCEQENGKWIDGENLCDYGFVL